MAEHVDILKPGTARPLARIVLHDDHVEVKADDEPYWREFLASRVGTDPDQDPRTFFYSLPDRIHGTYMYATQPHEGGDDCAAPAASWATDHELYGAGA